MSLRSRLSHSIVSGIAFVPAMVTHLRFAKPAATLLAIASGLQLVPEPLDAAEPTHRDAVAAQVESTRTVGTAPLRQPDLGTEHSKGVTVNVPVTLEPACVDPNITSGTSTSPGELDGCTAEQLQEASEDLGVKMFFQCGFSMDWVISEFYCIQLQAGGAHYMARGRCT